jgi:6-phosphogluconolactonase
VPGHNPYELDEFEPVKPDLPGEVIVGEDVESVLDVLASDLLIHATNCVRSFGDFHIAVCGGMTPIPLYRRLMLDPAFRAMPWRRTHLWLVDERRVPPEDEASNWRLVRELLGDHADIPTPQLHPIFAEGDHADRDYERQLKETLAWREKGHDRLDYVLLGMGADGHVASIFPGSEIVRERKRFVRLSESRRGVRPDRVTMTLHLINAARFISVFVTGEHKHKAVRRLAAGEESPQTLPARGLRPLQGELKWYMDRAAASGKSHVMQER